MSVKKINILFLDNTHECLQQMLVEAGCNCVDGSKFSHEEIKSVIAEYTGIIVRSRIAIDKEILDLAMQLKFIGRVGSGMESIDLTYAESRGIKCFNSPEGNRDAVGEHALGMLLTLLNRISIADNELRNSLWKREENRGVEIKGKTVGIIGYGNTGGAFARKLCGFEVNVVAYDKYKANFSDEFVKEVSLDEIQKTADIISLHVPLTDETKYMVNKNFIGLCKNNFWLVNTSRGPVIDTEAAVNGIKSGKISGAALDVFEYEETSFENFFTRPLPEAWKYLTASDKVILTPHIAGWTNESKVKLAQVLGEKIIEFLKN